MIKNQTFGVAAALFISLFTGLVWSQSSEAKTALRVMTYNTMCNMCGSHRVYGHFNARLETIADTIARHNPDLASLQELSNKRQIYRLVKMLKKRGLSYTPSFSKGKVLSYSDPVLLFKEERMELRQKGGIWLGPKLSKKFSFGWQFAIPRRFQWVTLFDKLSGTEFVFAGTHFDNHFENKDASAVFLKNFANESKLPVIFAGDTNLEVEHEGYQVMLSGNLIDSYHQIIEPKFYTNGSTYDSNEACDGGGTFPDCRIDHVFSTNAGPWVATDWSVDLYRYPLGKKKALHFNSDHRAVIVDFESRH